MTGATRSPEPLDGDLRARAELVGLDWAKGWFERVEREQRAVVGGWPGTMSEARAQVVRALVPWLLERGKWPSADVTNFEATARVVYSAARAAWRGRTVTESSLADAGVPNP
jgi:hypothetical protein